MKLKRLAHVRMLLVLVTVILVLAACDNNGSGSAPASSASASTTAPAAPSAEAATEVAETTEPATPVVPATAGTATACTSGDAESAEDPCVLTTAMQLQEIASRQAGHYALGSDIDASETATWNDGAGFAPIATFSGSFEGRGHVITGLVINRPGDMRVGLFAEMVDGARVHDLTLADVEVTGGMFVGALVATLRDGEISQVHVNGVIEGDAWVGGLVGSLQAAGTVSESSSAGSVSASEERVGGLAGQNDGIITLSFSLSKVHGGSAVGGLVGRSSGTIKYSYTIVGSEDDPGYRLTGAHSGTDIGGLAGVIETDAVITHSYTVSLADSVTTSDLIGHPLVGRAWGSGAGISASYWAGGRSAVDDPGRDFAEMRLTETFEDWDFETVWTIAEGEDYPDLIANPRR